MITSKALLGLVALLTQGVTAFPKPATSLTYYDELPLCAQSCTITWVAKSGCSETDTLCLCTTQAYVEGLACCVRANCDAADRTTTGQVGVAACQSVGSQGISVPASACPTTMGISAATAVAGVVSTSVAGSTQATSVASSGTQSTNGNTASNGGTTNSNGGTTNSNSGTTTTSKSGGVGTGAIIGIAIAVVVLILGLAIVGLLFYRSRSRVKATNTAAAAVVAADAKKGDIGPPPTQDEAIAAKKVAAETVDPVPPYDELDGRGVSADAKAAARASTVPYPGMHAELAAEQMHTPAGWRPGGDVSPQPQTQYPVSPASGAATELPGQAARVELDGTAQPQRYEVAGSGAGAGWQPGWVELPSGPDS